MHPYLPHLLSDIAAAYRSEIPLVKEQPKSFEEEMEEIERWWQELNRHILSAITAIWKRSIFPQRSN